MIQVDTLTYRLFEPKDLNGILALWENSSGWGAISKEQFGDWYINTPSGKCIIIVAADDSGEITGQLILIPASMYLNGKNVRALRLSAPVLHQSMRQSDLRNSDHPAMAMVRKGIEIARDLDYEVLYSLPAYGCTGLIKLMPQFGMPGIQLATFDCLGISLKENATWETLLENKLSTRVVNHFDDAYDNLWEQATKNFPFICAIVRNSSRLQWKLSHHIVIEVREGEKLVGYAAIRKKDGLLVDILAITPDDLRDILFAAIKTLHHENPLRPSESFDAVKIMAAPQFESLLNTANFEPINFRFAFACYPLQDGVDIELIRPFNWYIMPDD